MRDMPLPSKQELKDELVRLLDADLEALERAQQATREGATHEEAKPENDKDTRALEQSYLARGQAKRVEELRTARAEVHAMALRAFANGQPAALGAVVSVAEGDDSAKTSEGVLRFFLANHGGGTTLASGAVQVVTPKSPLGQAILGKCEGDECTVRLAGRTRELVVVEVV
jgi:transcription elongation GreA/GreB family factor